MRSLLFLPVIFMMPGVAHADFSSFTTGPVIEDYGPVADIETTQPIPEDAVFRHSFDASTRMRSSIT